MPFGLTEKCGIAEGSDCRKDGIEWSAPYTIVKGEKPVLGLIELFSIFETKNGRNSQFKSVCVANIFLKSSFTVFTDDSIIPLPAGCRADDPITCTFKEAIVSSHWLLRKHGPLSLCSFCTLNCCKRNNLEGNCWFRWYS